MGIELTRQHYQEILSMFEDIDENTEIECKVDAPLFRNGRLVSSGKTINLNHFQRVLNYAKQAFNSEKFNKMDVQLDVHHGDNRLTLVGMENVLYFCRHDNVIRDHIGGSVFVTQKNRLKKVTLHEYDISLKKSSEINLRGDALHQAVHDVINGERRFFRIKNRYTVVLPSNLRFDFTAVKTSFGSVKTLLKNLDQMKNEYEIELEVLNPKQVKSVEDKSALIVSMFSLMSEIIQVIDDIDFLMKKSDVLKVLDDYTQLIYQKKIRDLFSMPRRWSAGPQPVNLEKKHLLETKEDYPINIHAEYTVTLKADGERHLLYVDSTERVYLINSRLGVKDTGMNVRGYAHSLFDSEVMPAETNESPKDILLFDAYYIKGLSILHYPLVPLVKLPERVKDVKEGSVKMTNPSRLGEIEAFLKAPAVSFPYRRSLKQFWWPNNPKRIYESVQDAFSKQAAKNVDYEVDGVIFTPMYLPVGVNFTQQESREQLMLKKPKVGGTWESVLKWKPPSQNTIDFLVKEVPYPVLHDDGKNYKKFALFCGKVR